MADAPHSAAHEDHGHDDHEHSDHSHDDHDIPDPDESTIRTPMWLPFVGLGFLATLAIALFLVISPTHGSRASADADAGVSSGQPSPGAGR
jgi:hypothetical protein